MEQPEEIVRITIGVPASLRRLLKTNAVMNDRSFSGEIVRALKIGAGWKAEVAAGAEFGDQHPAAENDNAACQDGASIKTGNGDADDE